MINIWLLFYVEVDGVNTIDDVATTIWSIYAFFDSKNQFLKLILLFTKIFSFLIKLTKFTNNKLQYLLRYINYNNSI